MQQPLQIVFRGLDPSEEVQRRVRAYVTALERIQGDVVHCRVAIEARQPRGEAVALYTARVELQLPGTEAVAGCAAGRDEEHEDVHVALRDAFDAASKTLDLHARRRRQEPEPSPAADPVLGRGDWDVVDEAGWESFPASDPPPW